MRSTRSCRRSRGPLPRPASITKVDEAASLGAVISTTLRHKLKIATYATAAGAGRPARRPSEASLAGATALKLKADAPPRDEAYLSATSAEQAPMRVIDYPPEHAKHWPSSIHAAGKGDSVTGQGRGRQDHGVRQPRGVDRRARRESCCSMPTWGWPNVDVILGFTRRFHMGHVIKGEALWRRIVHRTAWPANRAGRVRHEADANLSEASTPESSAAFSDSITGSKSWWWIPRRD